MAAQESAEDDKGLWGRWSPWLIVSAAILGALALLALVLVVLPPLLVPAGKPSFVELAKAESDVRGNLVAALGVLAVLTGAAVGLLNFRESQHQNLRSLELSRRGQVNERFSKAIEQLGESSDDKVDVRIGAIYSLEQIARDSPEELHGPVVEILTAFLRGHSHPGEQGLRSEQKLETDRQVSGPPSGTASSSGNVQLRADFQAIATVLGRRNLRRDTQEHLDLAGVDLCGAHLGDGHLENANLRGAYLENANLFGAHLENTDLRGAHLAGAILDSAHLRAARLNDAHLQNADLSYAGLEKADLSRADLRNAILEGGLLEGAILVDAHLEGATLVDAHFDEANLAKTHLDKAVLRDAYLAKAILSGADLHDADLVGADFWQADLADAQLERAVLKKANLSNASLVSAILRGAHLEGAHLVDANLKQANLADAHLKNAALGGASLDDAILSGAHLEEASFRSRPIFGIVGQSEFTTPVDATGLTQAQLEAAHCDQSTELPSYLQESALRQNPLPDN